MADYWKSQPRKFCQYCKCWIADNKPSIEFHERGKNHKENVAAKITEIKKKSIDKAKQEERMSKDFAAMEEAALKAYEGDLKRMEREAAGLPPLPITKPTTQPQVHPQVGPPAKNQAKNQGKPQGKKQQKQKYNKGNKKPIREQSQADAWVEGKADDGNTYYFNTVTGESRWDTPQTLEANSSSYTQPGPTEGSSSYPWMEAVSPEGYTYYYNSETGASSWEKPAGFPSKETSGSGSKGGEEESQGEPSTAQPDGEGSSTGAPASQGGQVSEANMQSNAQNISFRKRKAEDEPSEGENDKTSNDAPKEDTKEMKKEEEVQIKTPEPELKKVEVAPKIVIQVRRHKTANPYGSWEKIKEEKDPYASVDLQLPQVEGCASSAPTEPPPEPKPRFKERVITSLGDEGGPATFRRKKTQNGKSRSLRQREDDD